MSGSLSEMLELMELARQRAFRVMVKTYPLEKVNEVLKMLEEGRIEGQGPNDEPHQLKSLSVKSVAVGGVAREGGRRSASFFGE